MTDLAVTRGPARRVLDEVAAEHAHHLGAMSFHDGLLPPGGPSAALPPSHAAWDQAASALPSLWSDLSARRVLADLPLLAADAEHLPDADLWRASVVLGGLVYAYVRCDLHDLHLPAPVALPSVLRLPWEEVARRMGRQRAHFSLDDLMLHNWARIDPSGPVEVQNLRILVPQTGSPSEHGFYMTFVEMTAAMTPLVQSMVHAQDAVVAGDKSALATSLLAILDSLHILSEQAFPKIDPVALSQTHVDPVVWAKLVAPTGIPVVSGVPGVSGAAAAGLQALDGLLGRRTFDSALGGEAQKVSANYAPNVRRFVVAMGEHSARDMVIASSGGALRGLFQNVVEAYAGDRGYLGVHRRKIYGYLQTATKVGRPSTASGISGAYRSRAWHHAHRALEAARVERYLDMSVRPVPATLASRTVVAEGATGPVTDIRLDLGQTGLTARPGDRLAVLPVNAPELVDRTLALLQATGEEMVPLTLPWRAQLATRDDRRESAEATLREVLSRAWLRPLTTAVARRLLAFAPLSRLADVIADHTEDTWEVPDALQVLAESGVKLQRLWRAEIVDRETICRILPPLPARMYSVAALERSGPVLERVGLVVGALEIESVGAGATPTPRRGTASSLLTDRLPIGGEVDVGIVRPLRFTLPSDPEAAVVMIAAGTGVAPFLGFIADRQGSPGHTWLLLASRTPDQVPDRERLRRLEADGHIRLDIAWSKVPREGEPTGRIDKLLTRDPVAHDLVDVLLDDSTRLYICGQGGFAATALRGIRDAVRTHAPDVDPDLLIRRLVASRRLMFDVFTTFTPTAQLRPGEQMIEVSDLVTRTSDETGWWTAINGVVYDMTLFRHLHPGGRRIIDDNAGVDCAIEYEAIRHHRDTEIQAMLETYRIGLLRRLNLTGIWGIAIRGDRLDAVTLHELYEQWVRETFVVVELRNSLRNELALRDTVIADEDDPSTLTPLKLGLLADTIDRFCNMLIPIALGCELADLWAVMAGLTSPAVDANEMGRRLLLALGHPPAASIPEDTGACWPELQDGLTRLRHADGARDETREAVEGATRAIDGLLGDVVQHLADGLAAFEQHQCQTLVDGAAALQTALATIPLDLQVRRQELAAALSLIPLAGPEADGAGAG